MMNNKSVVAIFIIGVALLLVAFWAGLNVFRDNRSASATQSARQAATPQPGTQQARTGAPGSTDAGQSRGQEPTGAGPANTATRYLVLVAAFGTDAQANKLT